MPVTDAGVAVQFIAVILAGLIGLVLARKHADARLLVAGLTLLLVSLMAVRAVH